MPTGSARRFPPRRDDRREPVANSRDRGAGGVGEEARPSDAIDPPSRAPGWRRMPYRRSRANAARRPATSGTLRDIPLALRSARILDRQRGKLAAYRLETPIAQGERRQDQEVERHRGEKTAQDHQGHGPFNLAAG